MLYLIVICFILEFIVVTMMCCAILVLDRKVLALSEKINVNRHTLKFKLRVLYDTANRCKIWVKCKKRKLEEQRRRFFRKIIKTLLIWLALLVFQKTNFRKKILFIELVLILYDTLRADCRI